MSNFPTQTIVYRLANGTLTDVSPNAELRGITADNGTLLFDSSDARLLANDGNPDTTSRAGVDEFFVTVATGAVKVVDTKADGTQIAGFNSGFGIDPGGRYVLFRQDIQLSGFLYRKDVTTGALVPAAVDSQGNQVKVLEAVLSGDGRFVLWRSFAPNITADTPSQGEAVYLTDLDNGTVRLISKTAGGTTFPQQAGSQYESLNLSVDERYAVFTFLTPVQGGSALSALVNPQSGTFRVDLVTGAVSRLPEQVFDIATDGEQISVDNNLVVAIKSGGGFGQVVVYNFTTGATTFVSAAKDGTLGDANSFSPEISADGRFVLFQSYADNLGPAVFPSTDPQRASTTTYVYLKDTLTGDIVAVDDGSDGGLSPYRTAFFSPDGHHVVYQSWDNNNNNFYDHIADISTFVDRTVFVGNTLIGAGQSIDLAGDINTSATLTLTGNSTSGAAVAKVVGGATLEGGGKIVLGNSTGQDRPDLAKVVTDGNGAGLDLEGFSITGNGTIGDSHLTLQLTTGSISATSGSLVIDTGTNVVANFGIFSAFGGTLKIRSDVDQSGGGAIVAYTGSNVWLGNVTIIGGSLKSFGTGLVQIVGDTLLDGTDPGGEGVSVQGALTVNAAMTLEAIGSLVNSGTIKIAGNDFAQSATRLVFDNHATLTGGGTILLTDTSGQDDDTQAILTGDVDATVVNVDNIIKGYGLLGDGKIYLQNQSAGSIVASGGTLAIRTDGLDVLNGGLIEAKTGAITVAKGIDNAGTVMVDAGYTFTITGTLHGSGVSKIAGTLDVGNTTGGQEFAFIGASGLLVLHAESGVSSLSGFTVDNRIRFADQSGLTTQVTNGTLKILSSAGATVASFLLDASEQQLVFSADTNGAGGTLVTATSSSNPSAGSGQTVSGATVSSGQTLSVFSGGTGSANTVSSGGQELVYSAGVATGDTVSAGGILYAFSGGITSGTKIASGGFAGALDGGAIVNATVLSNGIALARSGGTITSAVASSGGYVLNYGGVTVAASVLNAAFEYVGQGGVSYLTKLLSGGTQEILSAGLASGTVLSLGSLQLVLGSGSSMDAQVSNGGTALLVNGFQSHTVVSNGGVDYVEGAAGVAKGDVLLNGGVEFVLNGGTVSGTIVSNGGLELVSSGGTAIGAIISNGGYEIVFSSGVAIGGVISNGGIEYVQSGGVQSGGLDATGGVTVVLGGGRAVGLSVGSNGVAVESSGGVAQDIVLSQGGYDVVLNGGLVSGATLTGGGVLVVNSGGTATGAITFSGVNNEIIVASGGSVAGAKLSGFKLGDYIDLKGISFTPGVTSLSYAGNTLSGTLTVASGAHSASLDMLGQYVAGNFTLQNDGAGGTLVGDPPVSSGALAHA